MSEALHFPENEAIKLESHLPALHHESSASSLADAVHRPFVTLTFATSLDSSLSLAPGVRTTLSGSESKAMTHYLRTRHDAICVGAGTVVADDPTLNCRLSGTDTQPRPVVIDPKLRWDFTAQSKVLQVARRQQGLAPFIIYDSRLSPPSGKQDLLEEHGGKYLALKVDERGGFEWRDILNAVWREGLRSIMVEGGGKVINSLLDPASASLVDSVIVTIAPTWLGQGGVVVSPRRVLDDLGNPIPAARLTKTSWIPLGEDVVLCGELLR